MQISVPAGSKLLPLELISRNPHEKEVLLPRNSVLTFINEYKGVVDDDEYLILRMSYAPPSNNINVKTVREITEHRLAILRKVFDEEGIEELMIFEDEFATELRVDVSTFTRRAKFIDGVDNIFIDEILNRQ